jgi:hypothetical protein
MGQLALEASAVKPRDFLRDFLKEYGALVPELRDGSAAIE